MKKNEKSQSGQDELLPVEDLSDEMLDQVSGGFIKKLHPCNGCDAFTDEIENMNCQLKKIINDCPRGLKL